MQPFRLPAYIRHGRIPERMDECDNKLHGDRIVGNESRTKVVCKSIPPAFLPSALNDWLMRAVLNSVQAAISPWNVCGSCVRDSRFRQKEKCLSA